MVELNILLLCLFLKNNYQYFIKTSDKLKLGPSKYMDFNALIEICICFNTVAYYPLSNYAVKLKGFSKKHYKGLELIRTIYHLW